MEDTTTFSRPMQADPLPGAIIKATRKADRLKHMLRRANTIKRRGAFFRKMDKLSDDLSTINDIIKERMKAGTKEGREYWEVMYTLFKSLDKSIEKTRNCMRVHFGMPAPC